MILAVDTNILLDILIPNTAYVESSLNCVMSIDGGDELIICEIVYAELGSQFLSQRDLNGFLRDVPIRLVPSNDKALFEASVAWKKYSDRKKDIMTCSACGKRQKVTCDACKEVILYRQHIVSDFLIGAHAKIHGDSFITRDRGFYRGYFRDLNIVTPKR
jgi:predicted nucleic acid-binding protein